MCSCELGYGKAYIDIVDRLYKKGDIRSIKAFNVLKVLTPTVLSEILWYDQIYLQLYI